MNLFDLINSLANSSDNIPIAKDIERWKQIDESFARGDYIAKIDGKDTPITHIENAVQAINEKLEIEHEARLKAEKAERRQTIIGIVSAIAAVVSAVFAILTFFS